MHSHHPDDPRGVDCLRAYVLGETSEPVLMSCVHPLRRDEVRTLISRHRDELARMDAARSVILDAMLG